MRIEEILFIIGLLALTYQYWLNRKRGKQT